MYLAARLSQPVCPWTSVLATLPPQALCTLSACSKPLLAFAMVSVGDNAFAMLSVGDNAFKRWPLLAVGDVALCSDFRVGGI